MCSTVQSVTYKLQTTHTEDVFIVAGDFNQANMKASLSHFHQHVDFAKRGVNTLDLAYTNIMKAFKAVPLPLCDANSCTQPPAHQWKIHCEAGEGQAM